MRIEWRHSGGKTARDVHARLEELARAAVREGPICAPHCARAATCPCTRDCPRIPVTLSSDPQKYPIETNIAPLAFEIKRLGVFDPCWSCEGHNDSADKLRNAPAVWFYAHSVTHVRLLSESLSDIFYDNRLSRPWHVRLTFSDPDNVGTTFPLEPRSADEKSLYALRRDIMHLSEDIGWRMEKRAEALRRSIAP